MGFRGLNGPERAFGAALWETRKESGLSQERLALDAGFERADVSLVERGLKSPTIRSLVRLAEALKVRSSEIMARMEGLLSQGRRQAGSRTVQP